MSSQFRRAAQQETKKKGGKGYRGNWREKLSVPKEAPTPIIFQDFEYVDPNPTPEEIEVDAQTGQPRPVKKSFFKFRKHTRKLMTQYGERYLDTPCSAGWNPHNQQPCVGCAAADRQDKSVSLKDAFNIGVVHLAVYHRIPVIDQEKGRILSKKDNSQVYEDRECLQKNCNLCRVLQGQQPVLQQGEWWPGYQATEIQTVFGGRRYLEIGSGHLGDLGSIDKSIGQMCGGVRQAKDPMGNAYYARCNSILNLDGYACSQCNTVLIDAAQDPRSVKELEEAASKKYPCYKCQRPVWLKELNSCGVCGSAVVNNLFSGVIWAQRQGENTQSHIVNAQFVTLEDFEASLAPQLKALLGGKALKDRITELNIQYNFEELNKPRSLEDQAKRLQYNLADLGLAGGQPSQTSGYYGQPTAGGAPAPAFAPYGAPPAHQPNFAPPTQAPQYGTQAPNGPVPPAYQPAQPAPPSFQPPTKPHFGQ